MSPSGRFPAVGLRPVQARCGQQTQQTQQTATACSTEARIVTCCLPQTQWTGQVRETKHQPCAIRPQAYVRGAPYFTTLARARIAARAPTHLLPNEWEPMMLRHELSISIPPWRQLRRSSSACRRRSRHLHVCWTALQSARRMLQPAFGALSQAEPSLVLYQLELQRSLAALIHALWALAQPSLVLCQLELQRSLAALIHMMP